MITGSFDTAVGTVRLEIADGGSSVDMRITDIGSLNYDFDQTPESVTIDRVQALYNFISVTILYQDGYGFDLWERLIDSAITLDKIPCTLTIDTWDGQSYQFLFKLRIADLALSEINGTIQLKLNPNFDDEVDINTVYSAIDSGKKATFTKKSYSLLENQNNTPIPLSNETYTATGVKDWIDKALNEVFDNNFANVIKPSLANLGSGYTDEVYDSLQSSGSKRQLLMLDIESTKFVSSEDNTRLVAGTGTISIINPTTYDSTIFITGSGTDFTNEVQFGDYIVVGGISYGKIEQVDSSFLTFTYIFYDTANVTNPQDEFPNFGVTNSAYFILKRQNVMQQPAIKALKDLAGMEGAVFGCGFSRNFYFNRLRGDAGENVSINFDTQVVDMNPKAYYLSLGTSLVSQRADFRRIGEKLFGAYGSTNPNINRQIPNLTDRGSITRGNANASKELKIELAPAYPMLNKGIRQSNGTYNGDDILFDVGLESALTANGLRSYFQALSSTSGNILIEITLLGAFTVKPWNTISFGATAPERYANKSFRPTSISYDLKNDTVKIKAYQVDTIYNQVLTDLGFNFVFGEQLIQEGLIQAVQAQAGEAINRIQQALFRTAATVPSILGQAIQRIPIVTTGAGIGDNEPETGLFSEGDDLILFDPITLNSERFTVSKNQLVGEQFIFVTPRAIEGQFPAGSYVYISQKNVTAGVKIAENSVKIFNDTTLVGLLRVSVDNVSATSLQVRLNEKIKAGTDLFLGDEKSGTIRTINVTDSIGPGDVTMNIQAENLTFPAGTRIYGSESQKQAILQVDPFRVLTAVTQVKAQQAIATLDGALPIGNYTFINVVSARTMKLLPSTVIMVQDRTGATQYFTTIASSQNLGVSTTSISVVNTDTTTALEDGATVLEPSWRQSSQITQLSDEIQLRVTENRLEQYVNETIGGILPALSLPFDNSDEDFTGTNATLTPEPTYLEYLAIGTTPFMQRTTSYSASGNPIVTIRVQRIAGTNWGGAFGWSTDGTNFFTQNFLEPSGVDSDFQFTTIDLTNNVNYTGTIVAVRLYLGEANLDKFYIDQLIVGAFNPQTEVLADLSSRLTTAEGNITVTANEINSYVTGTQGLNKIADVTGTYGSSSFYDEITLANIRSGASIVNGQILILQNGDGSFQQVTVRATTGPLVSPLLINGITFSVSINNAVLFEPMYAASSRITQSAGQIVLKSSSELNGEVQSLALIRLDGTGPSSSVKIQGDLVAINNIEILRGAEGQDGLIRSQGFISGSTGWRIFGDGTAEFNNVIARGSFTVTGGNASTLPPIDDAFLNSNNSWSATNATLTTGADFSTLQVTSGSSTPAIFKTVSIDTSVNKFVYLEIQREVGTAWGAQLFWQVGGNSYSVNIPEPDNVDSEFASIVVDLRGVANWSGTATLLLLVFGIQDIGNRYRIRTIRVQRSDPSLIQLANLQGAEYNTAVSAYLTQRVIRSATKPSVSDRPAVGALPAGALLAGDVWIDTSSGAGDAPHTYDGTTPYNANGWIRAYTVIDGGNITTGTIDTNRLNVSNIITVGGIATETYASTEATNARNAARNNVATNLGYTDYADMVAEATAGKTIISGGFIRTSLIQVDNIFAVNASITATLSMGTNGVIRLEESSVNKYAIGKNGVALSSAITSSTSNARLEFRDNPILSSTGLNTGDNPTRLYLEAISPTGPGQAELWSAYNFAFKGVSGVVFNFENQVTSSVAATSDNDLLRRTDGDSRYGRLGSANTFTAANTFNGNVIVPDSTTSTHALRVSTADARYGRLGSANTFTAANTFTGNVIVPDSTTASHALNRQTGDNRYGRLGSANTFTSANTFSSNEIKMTNLPSSPPGSDYYRIWVDSSGYLRLFLPPP
jgi:hypothetical protein